MECNGPKRPGAGHGNQMEETSMTDLIFIGVMVAFFIIAGLYAAFCEKL
jgi:hypothetical protein